MKKPRNDNAMKLGLCSFVLLILLLLGCSKGKEQGADDDGRKTDTLQQRTGTGNSSMEGEKAATASQKPHKENSPDKGPIEPFLALTDTLAAHGWSADTTRMARKELYPGFKNADIRILDGRPFYRMKPEETRVLSGMGFRDQDFKKELAPFRKAKRVWCYFYRLDSATNWIVDGVIEQWKFEKKAQVKKAMKALREEDSDPFFNTAPYFHILGPYLFIFHTRAMNFSYEQEPYYKRFKKMTKGYDVKEKEG